MEVDSPYILGQFDGWMATFGAGRCAGQFWGGYGSEKLLELAEDGSGVGNRNMRKSKRDLYCVGRTRD